VAGITSNSLAVAKSRKQGLKSVQMFPEDFDGVLIGAPAYSWANLTGFQIHVNNFQADPTSPGYITPTQWAFVAAQVTQACDSLDSVTDGIISNPRKCNFQTDTLLCDKFPNGTLGCLSAVQVLNLNNIYQDWTESGTYIFPSYEKGSESMFSFTLSGFLWPLFTDYFALSVLNVSVASFNPASINLDLINFANKINRGGIIADDPNLKPFFARGGRLLVLLTIKEKH
jgi:feruloyl esterase